MVVKKNKIPEISYQDQVYLDAVSNREKRENIVYGAEPYICQKCGIAKHPQEFVIQYMNNYLVGKYRWLYECKACKKARIYSARLKERSTLKGAFHTIYKQILQSAKQRKLACDLTENDINAMWSEQDGKCYYSAYSMEYQFVGFKEGSFSEKTKYQVSLDRKDNHIGYIKSNCVLCCTFINKMKNTLNEEEFLKVCKDIVINLKK